MIYLFLYELKQQTSSSPSPIYHRRVTSLYQVNQTKDCPSGITSLINTTNPNTIPTRWYIMWKKKTLLDKTLYQKLKGLHVIEQDCTIKPWVKSLPQRPRTLTMQPPESSIWRFYMNLPLSPKGEKTSWRTLQREENSPYDASCPISPKKLKSECLVDYARE